MQHQGAQPVPARWILLLLLTTGVTLSPVLFAGFIRLDDYAHLVENPAMSVSGLARSWAKPYFGLYIPVTYSVWWALARIASLFVELGQGAWLFHAFNLALHLANVALVFSIMRVLIRQGRPAAPTETDVFDARIALLAALVFALHPAQVESVAWVSEMRGELAALFGILGICWHCRSGHRLLVAAFFVAAMLSKPTALVFPVILFAIDRIVRRRTLADSAVTPLLAGLPLAILAVVTRAAQPDSDQDFIPTIAQRPGVAADAITFQAYKVLVPFPLAVDYGRTPALVLDHVSAWWLALSALVAVAGIAVVAKALVRPGAGAERWQSLITCGLAIFLVSIAPVLGLLPFEFQALSTVADRYLYVPLFGVALVAAGILVRFRAAPISRRVFALPLVIYAALGFRQATLWRSTESLFASTIAANPRSYLAHFCIGDEQMRSGRLAEAVDHLQRSVAIKSDYTSAVLNLGTALTQRGEPEKAVELYSRALAKNPSTVGARAPAVASLHNNLGLALGQVGQEAEGIAHFHAAVEIFPASLNAHLNLGNVAVAQQRYTDAVAEYETALALSPGNRNIERRLELARRGAAPR